MRTHLVALMLVLGASPLVRGQETAPAEGVASIYVTAAADGGFASFLRAVDEAGMGPVLDRGEEFTLLIPSDRAVESLDPAARQALLQPEKQGALFAVVSHHLVRGRHSVSELRALGTVRSVSGQLLDIVSAGATVSVDGADIVRADIACSNGVIHVIDSVLVPNTKGLLQTLKAEGRFRTLIDLIDEADLDGFVDENAPLTLFAPTDAAFEKLDRYVVEDLDRSRNRAVLVDLLKRHLVAGELAAGELAGQGPRATLAGTQLDFARTPEAMVVTDPAGTARGVVVRANLDGPGGVIHELDTVLLPSEGLKIVPDGELWVGIVTNDSLSTTLQRQLGVKEGEAFVISTVFEEGPADRAGLLVTDVVHALDGIPATSENLAILKARKGYGGVINFEIIRAGQRMTIPVTVGVER